LIRVVHLVIGELPMANDNFCTFGCHFVLQMTTGWYPIRFTIFFKMWTGWGYHPVVILQMWTGWMCHPVVIYKIKWQQGETQGYFGHFNMTTLEINFFMEVQEECTGVKEETGLWIFYWAW